MKNTSAPSTAPGPYARFRRSKIDAGLVEMRMFAPRKVVSMLQRTEGTEYLGRQSARAAAVRWLEAVYEALESAGALAGDAPVNPEDLIVEVRLKAQ